MKDETVEVGLQVPLRHRFVRTLDRSLHVGPKVLDVVDVHIAPNIFALRMLDELTLVFGRHLPVMFRSICEQTRARRRNVIFEEVAMRAR